MSQVVGAGGVNAFGFNRDSNAYFKLLLQQQPQMLSQTNRDLIRDGYAPRVDSTWIQYKPSHQAFIGQAPVHHHWMQGHIAVAIPASVHHQWYRAFHPYR